jgi:hypothetical protein
VVLILQIHAVIRWNHLVQRCVFEVTHTHAHIHTHTLTQTPAHTHTTHTHTNTRTYTHTHTHSHTRTHTHTHEHTQTHSFVFLRLLIVNAQKCPFSYFVSFSFCSALLCFKFALRTVIHHSICAISYTQCASFSTCLRVNSYK